MATMNVKVMQSYVWHEGECFFVSTINRESSAALAYGATYAETMVWKYDYETRERGDFVGQSEGSTDSIYKHVSMCKQLHEHGKLASDEDA
jgi:hypothetical protein